jgi:hypothetical protein
MRIPLLAGLVLVMTLTACGRLRESRINPFNWFGRGERVETTDVAAPVKREDGRQLVADVTSLVIERTRGGAIIRATGLPPTQGFWAAELVPIEGSELESGDLEYEFLIFPPPRPQPASTQRSREITAAAFLTNARLDAIARITVRGTATSQSARR